MLDCGLYCFKGPPKIGICDIDFFYLLLSWVPNFQILKESKKFQKILKMQNFEIQQNWVYSKTIFLVLDQVYYWDFKSNMHNNYNYIIKTKWNYFNWKLFTTEEEAPSKLGLGFGIDSILIKREA